MGGFGVALGILVEFFALGKNLDAIRRALESLVSSKLPSPEKQQPLAASEISNLKSQIPGLPRS